MFTRRLCLPDATIVDVILGVVWSSHLPGDPVWIHVVGPLSAAERVKAVLAAREAFRARYRRSRKGHLWRTWRGLTVTVFGDCDRTWWKWCVTTDRGPMFSGLRYETEEGAATGLAEALRV